jgi:meso-butanediol dehydrogenase/(S,S)-butanediol dehydrogenase/diacetyl reductase
VDGNVAVVTGAGGAIGGAVARRLEQDGFSVATTDLDGDVTVRCDVRSEANVLALREDVTERLGAPWLLVNVAGVFFEHDVPDTTVEQYEQIMDVNVRGTFLTCRAFLPAMIAAGSGCIINIGSTAGLRGGHRRAVYNASKGAVVLFTRCLALDHGPQGVRVNCVCPGLIDTPMADWITSRPDALREFEQSIPAQRIGTVTDIAQAVSWLASDETTFMHGAVLAVDGGDSA